MRFYFVSIFSVMLLGLIYLIGTGLLAWFGFWLRKRWKKAWVVMVPLFILFYSVPVAEEFWIARHFAQLCERDAGLFIYKTVRVDGFYDDTHGWRADKLKQSGYKWMEGRDRSVFDVSYWRHEWAGGEIRSFKIDHPTARYHFEKLHSHAAVAHKIKTFEYLVEDKSTNEVLAREKTYARQAPWFYIGLDRPTRFCAVSGDYGEKIHATLYDLVLKADGLS